MGALGPDADGFAPGDLVVVDPFLACGRCYPCRVGKTNCCVNLQIIGVHRAGGFAERVLAPASQLHRVPAGLPPNRAAFAEPLTVGLQACRRAELQAAEFCLILGAGPIGLALVEVALARGARPWVCDVSAERLEVAARLGARPLPAGSTLLEQIKAETNGEGAPVVIEATGSPQVMASTAELVAAGGRIVIVGLVAAGVPVPFPGLDLTRREMTILGSRTQVGCFPEALALLASGRVRYPTIATEFPLWEAPATFAELTAHPQKVHKGIFVLP